MPRDMMNDVERILISREEIDAKVRSIAADINRDYADKDLVMVCILKGAVVFFADLYRHITINAPIDFMSISSYGTSSKSSGVVRIIKDLDKPIEGKHVLIVEDIVDSGLTLRYLLDILSSRNPLSVKVCTLLDKEERRRVELTPDYRGFSIPDAFVVGFGLDYAESYRNLPDIYVLKPSVYED